MEFKLTNRELDVMNVLWGADHSLTAKEIFNSNTELNINSVQAILKKLLKKELIKVDKIVYSGTVLTRSYAPILTADEFMVSQLTNRINFSSDIIMAALIKREKNESETIEKLENLLKQYREELEKE